MKKLMIAAAIVCAAAFAQASTVSWGSSADILTGDPTDENYTFGNAWIIALTSNDLTGLGVDEDGKVVLGEGMTVAAEGIGNINDGTLKTINSVVNADGWYALLLADGETSQWTAIAREATGMVADDDTDKKSISFGSGEIALTNDPVSVPEPTSGLLLLLGVAGLALRRRCA